MQSCVSTTTELSQLPAHTNTTKTKVAADAHSHTRNKGSSVSDKTDTAVFAAVLTLTSENKGLPGALLAAGRSAGKRAQKPRQRQDQRAALQSGRDFTHALSDKRAHF